MRRSRPPARSLLGATVVEFALVVTLFVGLLLAIVDLGRILFLWDAAAEATRAGARIAAVCDVGSPAVGAYVRQVLLDQGLPDAQIAVVYAPSGCDVSSCTSVTVSLQGYNIALVSPFLDYAFRFSGAPDVPPFSTTLPRESLSSAGNPTCS